MPAQVFTDTAVDLPQDSDTIVYVMVTSLQNFHLKTV